MDISGLTFIDNEPRVTCRQMQSVLGFAKIGNLHRLIKKNEDELHDFGRLILLEEKRTQGRGALTRSYLLNEHQSVALCMWASTPKARAARREIIEVFVAYRRGTLEPKGRDEENHAERRARIETALQRSRQAGRDLRQGKRRRTLTQAVTDHSVWIRERGPRWWRDEEVRAFATECYRAMPITACVQEINMQLGVKVGASTIHRYWQRLDDVAEIKAAHAAPHLSLVPQQEAS